MSKFKVGDRVKLKSSRFFNSRYVGEIFTIDRETDLGFLLINKNGITQGYSHAWDVEDCMELVSIPSEIIKDVKVFRLRLGNISVVKTNNDDFHLRQDADVVVLKKQDIGKFIEMIKLAKTELQEGGL